MSALINVCQKYVLQKDEFSQCIFQCGRVFFRTSFPYPIKGTPKPTISAAFTSDNWFTQQAFSGHVTCHPKTNGCRSHRTGIAYLKRIC